MSSLTSEERRAKINNIIRMLKDIEESTAGCQNRQDVTPACLDETSYLSSMLKIQETLPVR